MNYISKNKQSFGQVAKDYKKYRGSYNKALYEKLLSLVKNKKEAISILDLGCGVGNSTEPIFTMAKKLKIPVTIVGCDPDLAMLGEARRSAKKNKLPIEYVEGSAEKLPFEKEQFDIVISGAAFHWFATPKAFKEIQRVMKKNATYFVFWTQNVKTNKPTIGEDLYKKYGFKGIPKELRDTTYVRGLFTKAGFSKVKTEVLPYVERKTVAESIGLIKTNSGYAVLSDKDKKAFIQAMKKEYIKALGTKKITLRQEIRICYGTKMP